MISRIEAINYKCLKYTSVSLEPFHILVGPNASGKSTFLDVIAFLGSAVKNGPEQAVLERAQSLRELTWKRSSDDFELAVELRIPETVSAFLPSEKNYHSCRYEVRVGIDPREGGIRFLGENFFLISGNGPTVSPDLELFPQENKAPESIIRSHRRTPHGWRKVLGWGEKNQVNFHSETTGWNFPLRPGKQKSALGLSPEDERFPVSNWAKTVLTEGVQVLQLNSRAMRDSSRHDAPKLHLQPDGSNLPMVIEHLRNKEPGRFSQWLAYVQTVFPQIQDIVVPENSRDFVIQYSHCILVPLKLLSDGTLRFLALTLLAYLPGQGAVFLIEEPENGIHPKALEAVYQSLSSVYSTQVLCATHSPLFLGLAKLSDLVCFAMTDEGAANIVKGSEHPALKDWKGEVSLETLYAAGVFG